MQAASAHYAQALHDVLKIENFTVFPMISAILALMKNLPHSATNLANGQARHSSS